MVVVAVVVAAAAWWWWKGWWYNSDNALVPMSMIVDPKDGKPQALDLKP